MASFPCFVYPHRKDCVSVCNHSFGTAQLCLTKSIRNAVLLVLCFILKIWLGNSLCYLKLLLETVLELELFFLLYYEAPKFIVKRSDLLYGSCICRIIFSPITWRKLYSAKPNSLSSAQFRNLIVAPCWEVHICSFYGNLEIRFMLYCSLT